MYRFFQRNGKKILAVLGVVLMVTFIIPPAAKYGQSGRHGRVAAHIGKTDVYAEELAASREEWTMLINRLGQNGGIQFVLTKLGRGMASQIVTKPDLFFLLQQEAQKTGVRVNDDMVNTVFTNEFPVSMFLQPPQQAILRNAIRHVLELTVLHDRLAGSVKISDPMIVHDSATDWESVRLNIVPIGVGEFKIATTMPTTQEVQQQFDLYKNLLPDSPDRPASDPLGFGYEVPNRVKAQYITVPRKAVVEAVRAGKSAYDWEVAAQMYYAEHPEDFVRPAPATQPVTRPATAPTTQSTIATTTLTTAPSTQPAVAASMPATGPTTRPFAEVKEEILDKITAPDVDKLAADITAAIRQRLETGWQNYDRAGGPATQPAVAASQPSAPTTQPSGYESYAFLEELAGEIQKQFKVLPEVHQMGEWEDATQLAKEPGVGTAHTPDFRAFPQYATEDAIAFNPTTQPGINRLRLFQPSETLSDSSKNNYIFRLTAVSPAHAPDLKEIYARVEEDARTRTAYAAALAEARKLLDDAKKQGLSAAAVAAHRAVTSTGSFRLNQRFIPNFIAGPNAVDALIGKTRALLEEATPDHPHPVALVEMPGERKVVVVELADVSLDANDSELFHDKLRALAVEEMQQVERLAQKWFSYDAVAARLNYTSEKAEKSEADSSADQ